MGENINYSCVRERFLFEDCCISGGFLGHAFEPVCTEMRFSHPAIKECIWKDRQGDGI